MGGRREPPSCTSWPEGRRGTRGPTPDPVFPGICRRVCRLDFGEQVRREELVLCFPLLCERTTPIRPFLPVQPGLQGVAVVGLLHLLPEPDVGRGDQALLQAGDDGRVLGTALEARVDLV